MHCSTFRVFVAANSIRPKTHDFVMKLESRYNCNVMSRRQRRDNFLPHENCMPSASETYWSNFSVNDKDVERVYALMLERGDATTTAEVARAVIETRAQLEQERRARLNSQAHLYQPKNSYEVGQRLIFSALNDVEGTVQTVRASDNPRLAPFQVLSVAFADGTTREFASAYTAPHPLNELKPIATGAADETPEEIYARFGATIERALAARLRADKEFVEQDGKWLLRDAVLDIDEFGLNILEAAVEQNNSSMPTLALAHVLQDDAGLKLDLEGAKRETTLFSLDYALKRDGRFVDVGPRGETRWFLNRLVPADVLATPRVLQFAKTPNTDELLPPELETILSEIQDDNADERVAESAPAAVNFILTYPHRRAGSLPLTASVRALFPGADNPMLVTFVDEYNLRIPVWIVPEDNYIYGLKNWYDKHKLNPGALLEILPREEPFTATIRFQPRREGKSLWVVIAKVENNRLTFGKFPRPIAHKYDEEMLIVAEDQNGLDKLTASNYGDRSLDNLLLDVFPELVKLSSSSENKSIHAKTLYSAVNFAKRVGVRAVFSALCHSDAFSMTSGGYFVLQQLAARAT